MESYAITLAALAVLLAAIYFLGLVVSLAIGFVLQGKPYAQKWQSCGKYLVIIGIPLWGLSACFFSLHPSDDVYLQRFSEVVLRDTPKSARVVEKSPSLFGLHSGESCTYSRIALSQQDYSSLYGSLSSDSRFTERMSGSEIRQNVPSFGEYIPDKSSFIRADVVKPFNRQYALVFLSDGKHIEVHSCI